MPKTRPQKITKPLSTKVDVNDLLLFPEVMWDRYGDTFVFGWIDREDGKSDFCVLHYGKKLAWVTTSSKKYSAEFTKRWSGGKFPHDDCKRVEYGFPEIPNKIVLTTTWKACKFDAVDMLYWSKDIRSLLLGIGRALIVLIVLFLVLLWRVR